MKKLLYCLTLPLCLVYSVGSHAQTIADINEDPDAYTKFIVGVACKTRTNNEATVRNLAKGVFNRDSSDPVALNCGWNTPAAWTAQAVFNEGGNDVRIDGQIFAYWVRTAGTPLAQANDSFCAVFAAEPDDPQSPPNVNGTMIGELSPNFSGPVGADELDNDGAGTAGLSYPNSSSSSFTNSVFAQFTAFCRLAQGVRLQAFIQDGDTVTVNP